MYLKAPSMEAQCFHVKPTILHLSALFNILCQIFKACNWAWIPFWVMAAIVTTYFLCIYLDLCKQKARAYVVRPNPYQAVAKEGKKSRPARMEINSAHPVLSTWESSCTSQHVLKVSSPRGGMPHIGKLTVPQGITGATPSAAQTPQCAVLLHRGSWPHQEPQVCIPVLLQWTKAQPQSQRKGSERLLCKICPSGALPWTPRVQIHQMLVGNWGSEESKAICLPAQCWGMPEPICTTVRQSLVGFVNR